MTVLEQSIEDYAHEAILKLGGDTRKAEWVGRRHCPDRFIMCNGKHAFVEFKRPGEKPRPGQVREIERIRIKGGCPVYLIDSKAKVDMMVEYFK